MKIGRIVSGGQIGIDRAALDIALAFGIPCGGWCPRGRRAEDGVIPLKYPLTETPLEKYSQRTKWNVRDSDATLVIIYDQLKGGSLLTVDFCKMLNKPYKIVLISNIEEDRIEAVINWIFQLGDSICLNIAGPRASDNIDIYSAGYKVLHQIVTKVSN